MITLDVTHGQIVVTVPAGTPGHYTEDKVSNDTFWVFGFPVAVALTQNAQDAGWFTLPQTTAPYFVLGPVASAPEILFKPAV